MAVLILFHPSIRSSGGLATYLGATQSDERKTGKLEKSNQTKEKNQSDGRKADLGAYLLLPASITAWPSLLLQPNISVFRPKIFFQLTKAT